MFNPLNFIETWKALIEIPKLLVNSIEEEKTSSIPEKRKNGNKKNAYCIGERNKGG